MIDQLLKLLTKDHKEVPLFHITFNFKKHQETEGRESCDLKLHPSLTNDKFIIEQLSELFNYTSKEYAKEVFDELSGFAKSPDEFPLLYVTFNFKKYKEYGEKGSCDFNIHPSLSGDELIVIKSNGLVDHIRKNYNMEELV
ncbi:hypothetical protein P4679_24005 [Priestia megaterium]|uniref:hypothetical protein n=1 Tax=Priestia megaterium TaxID=1404 RepID=UPI002E1E8259|nr:hypothetical protein [Priestia megaterium]